MFLLSGVLDLNLHLNHGSKLTLSLRLIGLVKIVNRVMEIGAQCWGTGLGSRDLGVFQDLNPDFVTQHKLILILLLLPENPRIFQDFPMP